MNSERSFSDRLASATRYLLLAGIVAVAALILAEPKGGIRNPLSVGSAHADGVCAAPGYLLLTTQNVINDKLYVVDTTKQIICVYSTLGDQFRLVSARKFDADSEIWDGSQKLQVQGFGTLSAETGNGFTHPQADAYAKREQQIFDSMTKK